MLASLFSGHVIIWNYNTSTAVKSFEVTELPVRSGRFVPRKQWIVTGSDDMTIRAFNVNTQERVTEIREAHTDYIRCLEVHPTQSYVLSSSDDLQIKLWDWDKVGADGAWTCNQVWNA